MGELERILQLEKENTVLKEEKDDLSDAIKELTEFKKGLMKSYQTYLPPLKFYKTYRENN